MESQYNKVVFHNNLRNPPQDINEPTGIHDAGGNAGARLDNNVDNVMSESANVCMCVCVCVCARVRACVRA